MPLSPGKHTIEYDFKYDGLGFATLAFNNLSGIGRPGAGTPKVDGKVVSTRGLPLAGFVVAQCVSGLLYGVEFDVSYAHRPLRRSAT